jgi:hypothetical protein
MRPTTMTGASAAKDGETITTAVRNKHTSNPIIHFILFICNPSLSMVFVVIVATVMVFVIVTVVVIAIVKVVVMM